MALAKENEIQNIAKEIMADYQNDRPVDQRDVSTQIDEKAILDALSRLLSPEILHPARRLSEPVVFPRGNRV